MAVAFQDYYATLGVARTATAEDLKSAFRNLARLHHPDVAKDKVTGEVKFKEINEAYEVLGDPEKRRRYDELGEEGLRDPAGAGATGPRRGRRAPDGEAGFEFGGTGFSDFFESFFGGGGGGSFSGRDGEPARGDDEPGPGRDIEADLLVALGETLHGSRRRVTLRRPFHDGTPERTDTYDVRLPPALREGRRIRLAGQGAPGRHGAPAGDLYLRVRFARHPDLGVQGDDIYRDLDLTPWEAVLGARVKISTLDGAVALNVPPGTRAGSHLRVRGHGLPHADGSRGDLYAVVQLQVPTAVTADEKALWEKLAQVSAFSPRVSP